jgi:hypothetical protein
MFVLPYYNILLKNIMNFMSTTGEVSEYLNPSSIAIVCSVVFILVVFLNRELISKTKEQVKKSARAFLKPYFFKVTGNTVHADQDGSGAFLWNSLDTYFLKPADESTDSVYDDDNDDDDSDDEDEEEEEEEEDEDDEEENGSTNMMMNPMMRNPTMNPTVDMNQTVLGL